MWPKRYGRVGIGKTHYYGRKESMMSEGFKVGDRVTVRDGSWSMRRGSAEHPGDICVGKGNVHYEYEILRLSTRYPTRQEGLGPKQNNNVWLRRISDGFEVYSFTGYLRRVVEEPTVEQYELEKVIRDGYTYTKLRSLAPAVVYQYDPCGSEFDNYVEFAGGFYGDLELAHVLDGCAKYDAWLPWLMAKGFIRCKAVATVYGPVSVGDRFNYVTGSGAEFTLVRVGPYHVSVAFYSKGWASGIHGAGGENAVTVVGDLERITLDEFKRILGSDAEHWEAIYKTKH
jgi:hypothetical protein